jgi:hypothetical protein
MNTLADREKRDVKKSIEDENYYSSLPEHRRTAAVSTVAVLASGHNLEYVPEAVLNRNICRAALSAKDAGCTLLLHIPFPDVQKEGIQKFSGNTPAFVLYSFADIRDAQTAREAVKADAYCLQLVPDKLLTAELCKARMPAKKCWVLSPKSSALPKSARRQKPNSGTVGSKRNRLCLKKRWGQVCK